MSGRDIFSRYDALIRFVLRAAAILPRGFYQATWWMVGSAPGRAGIFARYVYACRLAAACGRNVMIAERCTIVGWSGLTVGDNVTIHPYCYIDASGGVAIGNNVAIAHGSSVLSFEHTFDDETLPIKYNPLSFSRVTVLDDVWIACGVRVLAGAEIGPRTVIAAGAVVRRGAHGRGVYAGVPAVRKRSL